jgi:tetratricopeptide (TPR) repeat protein
VVFSPDGKRIVGETFDNTVTVWDSQPLTPELRDERLTVSVLESLYAGRTRAELLEAIAKDPRLTAAVRERALELAGPYWENQEMARALRLVQDLLARGMLKEELIAEISTSGGVSVSQVRFLPPSNSSPADPASEGVIVSQEVRERVLELLGREEDNADALVHAVWWVVLNADLQTGLYHRALRKAETACCIEPDCGLTVSALGAAQYRVGEYEAALATLTRSDQMNLKQFDGKPQPSDVAFLAMAHYRLGHSDEARKLLDRLRQLLPEDGRNADAAWQMLLREAESLIKP